MQHLIMPSLPVEIPGGLVQYDVLFWSTAAIVITALIGWWLGRKPRKYPGRRQIAAELLVGWFDGLCKDLLGRKRGRQYLAVFGSLFLFLVISNVIGLLPLGRLEIGGEPYRDLNDDGAWQAGEPVVAFGRPEWDRKRSPGFVVPAVKEPTRNVNVPIGLSIFLAAGMYGAAVFLKGLRGTWKQLFEPLAFMFPLNLIGQVAQAVSVSFRLFGNIFGGAVVMIVVPTVVYNLLPAGVDALLNGVLAVGMMGFLGLFVGVIQAFVFTMLWITYHSDWVAEES